MQAVPEDDDENIEYDLTFIGACGMIDPPRKEVITAVGDLPQGRHSYHYDHRRS